MLKRNDCKLDVFCKQIVACCTLHNICESHSESFHEDWLQDESFTQPAPQVFHTHTTRPAEEVRNALVTYFSLLLLVLYSWPALQLIIIKKCIVYHYAYTITDIMILL